MLQIHWIRQLIEFQNLREGKYNLIALQDVSGNYFFDQNIDKIGYLNRLIELPKDSIINLRILSEIENFFMGFTIFCKRTPCCIRIFW